MIDYRGERFSGYNKPKRTPNHPTKSHVVVAKEGDQVKKRNVTGVLFVPLTGEH
jgi:hypothetical protein